MASLESHFQFRLWPNRSYPILATQLHALPQSGHRPTDMSASCQSGLMHCNKRSVGPLDLLSLGRVGDITELATTGLQVRRSSPGSMLSAAQLRNPRLQQDEISARLARIEPDDCTPCAVNARPSGLPSRSPSRHASRSAAVPPPAGRPSSRAIVEDLSLSR